MLHLVVLLAATTTAESAPAPAATIGIALATLWDSASAQADCQEVFSRLSVERAKRALDAAKAGRMHYRETEAEEPAVCTEATIAKLTRGTELRIEPEAGRCGSMLRVQVMSGKNEGKKGCVFADQVETPEPHPAPDGAK